MKTYWILFLPAVICFALPVLNILYQSAKASRAEKAKEEQRRRAAEIKQVQQAAKQAARERAAEIKAAAKQKKTTGSTTKRRPGRPRKNPAEQRHETISAVKAPAAKAERPAPLPTSCTPEQFTAWIEFLQKSA